MKVIKKLLFILRYNKQNTGHLFHLNDKKQIILFIVYYYMLIKENRK